MSFFASCVVAAVGEGTREHPSRTAGGALRPSHAFPGGRVALPDGESRIVQRHPRTDAVSERRKNAARDAREASAEASAAGAGGMHGHRGGGIGIGIGIGTGAPFHLHRAGSSSVAVVADANAPRPVSAAAAGQAMGYDSAREAAGAPVDASASANIARRPVEIPRPASAAVGGGDDAAAAHPFGAASATASATASDRGGGGDETGILRGGGAARNVTMGGATNGQGAVVGKRGRNVPTSKRGAARYDGGVGGAIVGGTVGATTTTFPLAARGGGAAAVHGLRVEPVAAARNDAAREAKRRDGSHTKLPGEGGRGLDDVLKVVSEKDVADAVVRRAAEEAAETPIFGSKKLSFWPTVFLLLVAFALACAPATYRGVHGQAVFGGRERSTVCVDQVMPASGAFFLTAPVPALTGPRADWSPYDRVRVVNFIPQGLSADPRGRTSPARRVSPRTPRRFRSPRRAYATPFDSI